MSDTKNYTEAPRGQRVQIPGSFKVNVSLKEWAKIVDIKDSLAYELHRLGKIDGSFKVGKFVRVHLPTYYAAKGIEAE